MPISLISANNPRWANAERTAIVLNCRFSHIAEEIPFCAMPDDSELHGRIAFEAAAAGDFGVVAEFVAPVLTAAQKLPVELLKRGVSADKIALALLENDAAALTALRAAAAAAKTEAAK